MDSADHKMTHQEWKLFNYHKKLDRFIETNRYYCYCGHSVTIPPTKKRIICTHCGYWIYRDIDKQIEKAKSIEKENQEKLARIKRERFKNQLKEKIVNAI